MELSISVEPYLNGSRAALKKYLDRITALKGELPISVHYDCFEYKPEIIELIGGYTDKIAVHLHSMLPDIRVAAAQIAKFPFASVSVHNDNQYIVYLMNITNTIYSDMGVVFDLPTENIAESAEIIKRYGFATVMTVVAGASGRPFDKTALKKIEMIKKINPDIKIIIDGGINYDTIGFLKGKPVDIAVVGSYAKKCYEAGDLRGGLKKLLEPQKNG
jgi:pentose-5-phosphate-3-epimerase